MKVQKAQKNVSVSSTGRAENVEFEFSQFMRLFLISNLSLLRVGNEGEMFFIWSLSALSRA